MHAQTRRVATEAKLYPRASTRSVHIIRNYFRRRRYDERANKKNRLRPHEHPVLIVVLRIYLCVRLMIPFYLLFDV
jgi:hypothetical protein